MEQVTLHNYEAFLLDYLEGSLDEAGIAALKQFALTHPELDIDLEAGELPVIEQELVVLDHKEDFKKSGAEWQEEELLEYLEGILPEEKRKTIALKLINNSALANELKQFEKTRLEADAQQHLPGKQSLLKTEEEFILNNRAIAYYENQLSPSEKQQVDLELEASAALRQELCLVKQTRLIPDAQVIYPDKQELKKQGRVIALLNTRTLMRLAAAVLLLLTLSGVLVYYTRHKALPEPALANKHIPAAQPIITQSLAPMQPVPETITPQTQLAHANGQKPGLHTRTNQRLAPVVKKDTNNPAAQQTPKENPVEIQLPSQNHTPGAEEPLLAEIKTSKNQLFTNSDSSVTGSAREQVRTLAVLEERYDDDEAPTTPQKKGFWKKAVALAKQANHFGLRSVDGSENGSNRYSLSFSAFSVEKH